MVGLSQPCERVSTGCSWSTAAVREGIDGCGWSIAGVREGIDGVWLVYRSRARGYRRGVVCLSQTCESFHKMRVICRRRAGMDDDRWSMYRVGDAFRCVWSEGKYTVVNHSISCYKYWACMCSQGTWSFA